MSSPPGRILIVDDDAGNRDVLGRLLAQRGYAVVQVAGGRDALGRLAAERFSLVLLDLWMPDLDGFAVLAAIRHMPEGRRPPVIVVSAADDLESVARCIELGAADYVVKPVTAAMLDRRLPGWQARSGFRDRTTPSGLS